MTYSVYEVKIMHQRILAKRIAELQNDDKIYLDLSFQSEERWNDKQRRKYVKSLLSNSCPTPIVLADVQSCMKYCEDTYGVDSADYLYFKDKDDVGYQYISIDGNNRSRAIARFSKNTFGLNTTEEHKISGIEQPAYRKWKPTNSTRTYNTLPDFIKTHFDSNIHVVVYKVVEASLTDLCELFININDGVTLNPQEKRNAIVCKLASIVRELSQDFEKFFSLYWTKESMKRRNHEEFIVSLWVHIQKSTGGNINKSERDYAYEFESNETVQNKERQQVRDVLKIVSECCVNQDLEGKLLPNEATRFDFCMVVHYLLSNNYKIINKRKFFEWFVSSYTKIKNAVDENGNNIILWKDGRGLNARDYSGTQRSYDGGHRAARLSAFVIEFSQLDEEVIIQKDSKRQFETNIRPLLWLKQDKKCAISNKEIALEHVMNGNVTHVDHIIPHSKGGLTTIKNARLVFADENLNKSDDIPIGTI